MSNPLEWLLEQGTKYAPLIKTGTTVAMGVASYLDQKKKNEMQQAAYDDYMAQVESAGQEARAAIALGKTGALPMVMTGVPQTKADVTDFTAVAAQGGLMSIPNKQRKRYARGPEEWEVETMDEEVLTPYDLQMEEGVNIGEQVFYDTGNPRQDAWGVWSSGGVNQEIYEFDFEIFFDSGDWKDMLKGDVPMQGLQGNTMMASADPVLQDEYDKYVFDIQEQGGTPMSIEQFRDQAVAGQANGGIIGLRHGGRIGYAAGGDMAHRLSELIKKSNAGTITSEEENEMEQLEIMLDYGPGEKDGGRIRKAPGGIMNLGGLEKDYRTTGGFVPIGGRERADDVPARLSKNEFVMTADAVRAAGGGSINKGAQRMYDTMKHLEASPGSKRMTA